MNASFAELRLPAFLQPLWVQALTGLALLLLLVLVLHLVARRWVLAAVRAVVQRSRASWDEVLFEHRVPHRLSYVIPLVGLQMGLPLVPGLPREGWPD